MFTKIECGECGGAYVPSTPTVSDHFHCERCRHEATTYDLRWNMEEGESLTYRDGVLGYVTAEVV